MKVRIQKHGRTYYTFYCPGCNDSHMINDTWGFNGDVDKPTFTPSVFVHGHKRHEQPDSPDCHSFVTDGQIQFLGDSTHALAGQTVPLPNVPVDKMPTIAQ